MWTLGIYTKNGFSYSHYHNSLQLQWLLQILMMHAYQMEDGPSDIPSSMFDEVKKVTECQWKIIQTGLEHTISSGTI